MRVRQHFPRRLTSRAAVLPLVAFAALTTFACNLDKLTKPATSVPTLNASVTGDTTVSMGATLQLSISTATGGLTDAAAVVYVSNNTAVATVDASTGVVTGVSIGVATISATVIAPELGEVPATALKIRVKYAGISIKAVDSLIAIGMTKVIDVRGTNPAGVVQASIPFVAATMTITSRDPTIFTVNTSGALVAVKNGSALVVVQFDGLKDSTTVKVRQVTRAITYIGAVAGQLPVGSLNKDRTIAITASDSLGVAIAAPTVTWATSDLTTMTIVAATGVARALKLGTVTITATSDGFQKSILASISQVPATLTKTAATDAQSATVNTAVALAPEVTVVDSGNTPIPSVAVTFAVASGGGSVTGGSQISATTGKAAATSWVLGTVAGANTLVASAGGASATFTATGTAASPKKLGFTVQPTGTATAAVIAPAIQVSVLDSLGNATTSTASITIALGSGPGALGGTLTASAVAGVATFNNITLSAAGSYTIVATSSGLISATSNSFGVYGAATKLGFITQPVGGTASQVLSPVRVAIQDAGGNTVATDTRSVTITIGGGTAGAILGGTLSVAAVNGIATFSTLTVDRAGTAYTLGAATTVASSLTGATSATFDMVAVGPAAKLAFTVQPTNSVAGASITPNIQVTVQDAGGATVTSSTASITLGIETNPGSGALAGTVTVNAVSGVAVFSGVSVSKVGTGYKLNATSGTLTKAISSAFNVTAGAVAKVGYLVSPSNAVAGAVMAPAVQVALQDANGNTVTSSTANVTLTVSAGPGGSTLGGTVTQTAVAGVATFNNLTLTPASAAYQITASSPSVTSAVSPTFTITATATSPIKLGFLTQPSNVASGSTITPSIQVAVQDANGATVTTSNASITLALNSNSGGATASGVLTVGATNGVATFTSVLVGLAGTGYTLAATAPAAGLTAATSTAFNVTPGTASHVAFVVQPATEVAGVPFSPDLQVAILDQAGNTVTSATNVITLNLNNNPGNSSLAGTTSLAAVNGIATFPGVRLTKTGAGYTLFANSTSLGGQTSTSFDVTPAPAIALGFKNPPTRVAAGASQPAPYIQVAVVDSLGNVTGGTDQISLVTNSVPTNGAIIVTSPVAAVAGVATFSDAKFNVSGCYTLAATAANLATVISNTFCIAAGPAAALKWVNNPTTAVKNGPITGNQSTRLEVDIVDAFGNIVNTDNTTSVTIAIASPGLGTLTSPTSTNPAGAAFGEVFFGDLSINTSGSAYKLTASAGTLTAATSTSFDVAAFGTASKWKFQTQPTSTTIGTTLNAVTVLVQDAYGNTVTAGTGATTQAFLGLQSNSFGNNLTGTTPVNAVAGVATFNNVKVVNGAGDGLALQVSGSFNGDVSSAFNVAVATPATTAFDVAITGTTALYLERGASASTGTLKQVNMVDGTSAILQSSLNFPSSLVTDGTNVYWLEDGNGIGSAAVVKRAAVGAVNGLVTVSGTMTTTVGAILQTDGSGSLYFVANNAAGTQRDIKKLATTFTTGLAPTALFTAACGVVSTCLPTFALSGSTMYYWNGSSAILSIPTAGGTSSSLVTSITAAPISMAVGSSTIFWGTTGAMFSAPTAGGAFTSRATTSTSVTRIAFDGSSVYSLEGATIRKYAIADFSFTALTAAAASQALAIDASTLYFSDNTAAPNSHIHRILK